MDTEKSGMKVDIKYLERCVGVLTEEIKKLEVKLKTTLEENEKLKDKIIHLEKKIVELSVRSQIYESDHKVIQDIAKQPKNNINNRMNNVINAVRL